MALAEHLQVMVVDDTSVSRMFIIDALDKMGIRNVKIAKNGKEALTSLMAKPVHLVISDMNMPLLDGLGLLCELRNFNATKAIGFILVTGSADQGLVNRGKSLGMNNFVAKPFTFEKIKGAIEAVVGRVG